MERADDPDSETASRRSSASAASTTNNTEHTEHTEDVAAHPPEEQHKKQKKHGRVHKREKELYGLVTPVFLPLLDAREAPSPEKERRASTPVTPTAPSNASSSSSTPTTGTPSPAGDAPGSRTPPPHETRQTAGDMAGDAPIVKERSASDPGKKTRRSSIKKKSALRHSSTPRNRKRVSLVIDDQVVLPSDMIQEPPLTSPGSETTSATNSTASLDDMIDPRLTSDAPVYIEHHDAVHHSLPLGMNAAKTSPIKAAAPVPSLSNNPTPILSEAAHSPPTSPNPRSPTTALAPPSYATRSFLDPPPERMHIEDIPLTAGPEPIYTNDDDPEDQLASLAAQPDEEHFDTYVGGISGSGVADVNQVGSVGYPSSLGASYLESYMQGRPLSVRMAAAEREGDQNEVKRLRGLEEKRKLKESQEVRERRRVEEEEWEDHGRGRGREVDDDEGFMGGMDDF